MIPVRKSVTKIDCHQNRLSSNSTLYEVAEYTYSIYSATGIDNIYERADNIRITSTSDHAWAYVESVPEYRNGYHHGMA